MQEITNNRGNPLIDPVLHAWHYEVPGLPVPRRRGSGRDDSHRTMDAVEAERATGPRGFSLAPWASPVLLSLGMFFLWLDLEDPWNAWRFYMVLKPTSPMSWGSWILLAIYPASILLAWAGTPADLARSLARPGYRFAHRLKALGTLGH